MSTRSILNLTNKPSTWTRPPRRLATEPAAAAVNRLRYRIRTVLREHPSARAGLADYFTRLGARLAAPPSRRGRS